MKYQVLARKWRPHNFTEVVGQEHVVQSLVNALRHGRLHHAYLFTGTRGVGKTTLARVLAKAFNCENLRDFNPCGECPVCRELDEGRFLDLIEVDAASRTKVEDTRDLLDNAQYAPSRGRYKVYLIDEVHMLSGHSFNALLKTLEEPPPHVKFLLATTDPQKIPVTVLSRCLQFNLKRLSPRQIFGQMAHILECEEISFEPAALNLLSRAADGSMRDGLSLLDQAIVYGAGQINLHDVQAMLGTVPSPPVEGLLKALAAGDAEAAFAKIEEISSFSIDFAQVLEQLLLKLHNLALRQLIPSALGDEDDELGTVGFSGLFTPEDLQLFYQIALVGRRDLEWAPDPRSGFEMLILRMMAFKPAVVNGIGAAAASGNNQGLAAADKRAPPEQQLAPDASAMTGDWAAMISAMKLESFTKQLAINCMLEKMDGQACVLMLDAAHQSLMTPKRVDKLQSALQTYVGKPIKLTITTTHKPALDTPALQALRKKEGHQQAAVDAIHSDPQIIALQEQFDARVLPGSIEPIGPSQ